MRRVLASFGKPCSIPLTLLACLSPPAPAACDLGSGSAALVCDSGSSGPFNGSDNGLQLNFPPGGSGAVNGNLDFGNGNDRVEMQSGTVTGSFNLGAGADSFTLGAGSVSGDINQGPDRDEFNMSGGSLRNLTQGDGLDRFVMTGGTISNAFEDGDWAQMSGGSIGRVDMKLDDNYFELSGGSIIGNLVTGFGRDTVIVSDGRIGGVISTSGGDDRISLSGGEIGGVRASFGNDRFDWQNGGQVRGEVQLGEGDDTARLAGLDEPGLTAATALDGGPGNDSLTLDATRSATASRYRNWESLALVNGALLSLDQPLVLGDAVSQTGSLSIDPSSRLASSSGVVRPFVTGQNTRVQNAGLIDLSQTGNPGNTLQIHGDYQGQGGQLRLRSVLGDDSAISDRLVVAAGNLSGATRLNIINAGGSGAQTLANGIEVVQARDGAVSEPAAFSLPQGLSAGPYQYYLYRGGVTAGSENSWFLRSSLPAAVALSAPPAAEPPPSTPETPAPNPTPPTPVPPPVPPVATTLLPLAPAGMAAASALPSPAPGTPVLPAAQAQAEPVPLYRLEVANYSAALPAAAALGLGTLGTFHERQGEQSLLGETGRLPAAWARLLGQDLRQGWSGAVAPRFEGSLSGYQVGQDLWAGQTASGRYQRVGLFVAQSRLSGEIQGFAEGFNERDTGRLRLRGDSLGGYWTLSEPQGGYLDLVVMSTRLEGKTRSLRGLGVDLHGRALSLSAEAGYPWQASQRWQVEPQLQLVHQRIELDSRDDGVAHIGFDAEPWSAARAGVRVKGRYTLAGQAVEPYARVNLWHTFAGQDAVLFDHAQRIHSEQQANRLELGVGVAARLARQVSLYLGTDYSHNLDDRQQQALRASLGVRVSW
ncbi:autotransporter outer membrane beta-barrel domain-containing protein [Pseudomonas sp. DTU_2021_1001937_2_SI_NGA_ILE_001]|uniref:autotransporter family protein n=1 Tax=Pseudomonas sp. DTU_2021_1001937_2_SI_NGA_ILE_001 TaxID=3077589 RepID=UPI0028FC109C|nr:autotransporter outer membrane beta-barrel domain-containing protein [Pseudomonas sp. DTU_2021_1001937_2_SI_NGA_ILE_001]WNW10059.1 autotransporter outer membrane beta-barrel domain-containing protein [Pseudomonas sp. DTU_2021_1001937_2_SI_NGA_ILE_001]